MTTVTVNSLLVERVAVSGGAPGHSKTKIFIPNIATSGSDSIASVTIDSEGSGYATPPNVAFTGGNGSGAAGVAVLGYAIASVTMHTFGLYVSKPTVSASVGSGATLAARMNVMRVYQVAAAGSGYSVNDILTFAGGTFTTAGQIRVTSVNGSGGVTGTSINNNGGDYSVLPSLPVSVTGGTGTGATFNLFWGLHSITVSAGGQDFDPTAILIITGGGGSGATGTINLASTGGVKSVTITNPGDNYSVVPDVVFSGGGGSGAAGTAVQTTTNDPVPLSLSFVPALPTANYMVKGSANQAAGISHANKTANGVDLTLTPLSGGTLAPGLIDIVVEFISY